MKKKSRGNRLRSTASSTKGSHSHIQESIHFRLCHLCLNLNEASSEVSRCEKCNHEFHSISDYLMSDDIELAVDGDSESDLGEEAPELERITSRGAARLIGFVAIL